MFVYALINKKNPKIPFYIGITTNPERRFKQHQYDIKHELFSSKEDMELKILFDTGDNEYSEVLAEKIEIELILHYGTYYGGSNKCIDAREVFEGKLKFPKSKDKKNRKQEKIWKQMNNLLENNPFYSIEELVDILGYKRGVLNNVSINKTGLTLSKFLKDYRDNWFESNKDHIKININW